MQLQSECLPENIPKLSAGVGILGEHCAPNSVAPAPVCVQVCARACVYACDAVVPMGVEKLRARGLCLQEASASATPCLQEASASATPCLQEASAAATPCLQEASASATPCLQEASASATVLAQGRNCFVVDFFFFAGN